MDHVRTRALPSGRLSMFRSLRTAAVRATLVAIAALTLAGLAVAQRAQPGAEKDAGGKNIYQRVLKSTVWILVPDDLRSGRYRTGSGALIDVAGRLVVTNYHVVRNSAAATVLFPSFNKNELVAEKEFY